MGISGTGGVMNGRIAHFSAVILLLGSFSCSDRPKAEQPILYSHKIHVEKLGLECIFCHKQALEHQKALIPNIEVCRDCHGEAMTESKEEEKLVGYIKRDERIPWVQVHRVPGHAYFSHRRHVSIAKIDCSECHGVVGAMALPFSQPHVPVKMAFCVDCHEKRRANTDCAACHR